MTRRVTVELTLAEARGLAHAAGNLLTPSVSVREALDTFGSYQAWQAAERAMAKLCTVINKGGQ